MTLQEQPEPQPESADNLRTRLAAERTYAAWIRTGLMALLGGIAARALLAKILPVWFGSVTGSVLVLFSAFCFCAAVWRELTGAATATPSHTRHLPDALLLTFNGFLVFVSTAALVGIWVARA